MYKGKDRKRKNRSEEERTGRGKKFPVFRDGEQRSAGPAARARQNGDCLCHLTLLKRENGE